MMRLHLAQRQLEGLVRTYEHKKKEIFAGCFRPSD